MTKHFILITSLLFAFQLKANDSYFDSLQIIISPLSSIERIEKAHAVPFDKVVGNPEGARKFYVQILNEAINTKDDKLIAESYKLLGLALYYKGDYDKSFANSFKAIKQLEKVGSKTEIGNLYCSLGYQMKRWDLKKAFGYMRTGISLLEVNNDEIELTAAYNNFGVLHEMNNNIDSALYYYFKGLVYIEEINDSIGIPYSYNNIAGAYVLLREFDVAKEYYDKASEIRKKRNDINGLAENYSYYGDLYFKQEKFEQAIPYYLLALEKSKTIGYIYLCQTSASQLALSYQRINDFKQAYSYQQLKQNYKDSLLNQETNKAIAQLEIQFDTEKKEKELIQQNAKVKQQTAKARQRNLLLIGLSILIVFLILLGYLLLKQQRLKQKKLRSESLLKDEIAKEKLKNKLHEERLRISRDLHDNIGSQLTFITSSIDNLKFKIKEEETINTLSGLTDFTRSTIIKLRDTIWAMNKGQIKMEELHGRILNYIKDARLSTEDIDFIMEVNDNKDLVFNSLQGINLFRIIQEAINNAIKYGMGSSLKVSLEETNTLLKFSIEDNGIGFVPEKTQLGNGLKNMEYRAKEIEAEFHIYSEPNKGTRIEIVLSKDTLYAV